MDALICDAVRTPIGRYGGALSLVRADDLAALPIAALIARNPDVDWASVDDVIYGSANQAGEDNRNVARMAALLAGLPVKLNLIRYNPVPAWQHFWLGFRWTCPAPRSTACVPPAWTRWAWPRAG